MKLTVLTLIASFSAVVACGPAKVQPHEQPQTVPSSSSPLFPSQAATPAVPNGSDDLEADGKPLVIHLEDGRTVNLQGTIHNEQNGLSRAQCAVTVNGQRVATMGSGPTEVYTCDGLVAAGLIPARDGLQRIGLIYDVSSPNADFRTAVVLEEPRGGWRVDASLAGKFDGGKDGRSIANLRAALKERTRSTP